jgi:integrase
MATHPALADLGIAPRLLTREQAAAYCGLSVHGFSDWVKTGRLPGPIRGTVRWDRKAPRKSPIILTNSEGKPWSESGFQGAWGKATMRAGIRGLTFHDLRGTAVVTLARAGCNEVEIYSITRHKPGDVRAILTAHYLPRDAEVAVNAIAKLNRYKARRDQKEDGNSRLSSRPC